MVRVTRKPWKRPSRIEIPAEALRTDIGVVSPFALVSAIKGRKIPWGKMDDAEGRKLLEDTLGIKYELLFSEMELSPLYFGVLKPAVSSARSAPDKNLLRVSRDVTRPVVSPEAMKTMARGPPVQTRVLTQKVTVKPPMVVKQAVVAKEAVVLRRSAMSIAPDVQVGAPPPCSANVNWGQLKKTFPLPPPPQNSQEYDQLFGTHPIQGCAKDCFFIAALAALAWTDPGSLPGYSVGDGIYEFTFAFVDDWLKVNGGSMTITTDDDLPLDTNTKDLAYARCREWELAWAALYEKAYALFKGPQPPPEDPDIPTVLNEGNPVNALCSLAYSDGMVSLTRDPAYYNPATGTYDGNALFNAVNSRCIPSENGSKTMLPMVAYTYKDIPAGLDIIYDSDVLVKNHAYSVLGTHIANDGKKYIVLRNPYGFSVAPNIPGIFKTKWPYRDRYHNCGAQYEDRGKKDMELCTTTNLIGDGAFAMEAGMFARYFQAFGWVGGL